MLAIHRAIAKNIALVKRCERWQLAQMRLRTSEQQTLRSVGEIWTLATERLTRARHAATLAMTSYVEPNADDVEWFLEGLVTSLFLADTDPARAVLRDSTWVKNLAQFADRIRDTFYPGRPTARVQYSAALADDEHDDVFVGLLAGIPQPTAPRDRLPQMRAPPLPKPKPVTYAPEPPKLLCGVLYAGDAAPAAPRLEFVQRPTSSQRL